LKLQIISKKNFHISHFLTLLSAIFAVLGLKKGEMCVFFRIFASKLGYKTKESYHF
jgi:hypothetical protein